MAKKTTERPLEITQADVFARQYYQRLVDGRVERNEVFPVDELRGWSEYFRGAFELYQMDLEADVDLDSDERAALYAQAARNAAQSIRTLRNVNPNLDELLKAALLESSDDEEEETKIKPPAVAPKLPEIAQLDYKLGASSRAWLDRWIAYAGSVLDGAPRIHLEGAGLFAISSLIARRVKIKGIMNKSFLTNLYIALASKSSTGKSSIAELAVKAIDDLGLYDEIILEGDWTPQLLTRRASGKVDPEFVNMDDEEKAAEEKRMRYAGFQSWFFDEFGKFLLRLNSQGNTQQTARLASLILDWYYGKGKSQGSVTNGTDRVREVYLSIIGCMTVSNVKQMNRVGGFWEDGMFSRIVTLCPPIRKWTHVRIFSGSEETPENILTPLSEMHDWLGKPVGKIAEKDVGRGVSAYRLQREFWPEREIWANEEIRVMYENYFNAVNSLAADPDIIPVAIESSYRRLPEYALKIAGMFACINRRDEISREDWIAAQEIVDEYWRPSIHEFYEQVFEPTVSKEREVEDRIYDLVKKFSAQGEWITPNKLRQRTGLATSEIARLLDGLVQRKLVAICYVPHAKHPKTPTVKYAKPGTAVPAGAKLPPEDDAQSKEEE